MKYPKQTCLILFSVLVFSMNLLARCPNENWTQKKAVKWFKSREWAGGMTLKADRSVDKVEFAKQYHKNKRSWDLVFKWLEENDPETVAPGKYIIDSMNVTVNVTDAPSTKPLEETKWEGHCQYIDLQYIARGKERMGIAPMSKALVVKPYNASRDNGLYQVAETDSKYIVAQPGTFLIFFPSDAHRPNIRVNGYDTVKKIVFKIKADTSVDPDKCRETETKSAK